MATPWTFGSFSLDEIGGSDTGRFSRGDLVGVYNIARRQIISTVVAHNPGERRTNSRDVAKEIKFTGFIWGNPEKTEARYRANVDLLHAALSNGIQQLCVDADGRYYLAELAEFNDGIQDGDVWHSLYMATFYSESPYSYGAAPVAQTILTSTALTLVSGNLYAYTWNAGASNQLGSAPSPLVVTVTLVAANGCFYLALTNNATAQTCAVIAPPAMAPFLAGDVITFDGVNGQATLTRSGATTKSPLPVVPLSLNANVAAPTSLTLSARATSAPVCTVQEAWTARYR